MNLGKIIDEIYKAYDKYLKGDNSVVKEVSELFRFKIDETRLSDYKIVDFDLDKLFVEVVDVKTETTFKSGLSKNSEVLGIIAYVEVISFVNVHIKSPLYERDEVYFVDGIKPILERLIFRDGEYSLKFERTQPGVIDTFYKHDGVRFSIHYFKNYEKRPYKLLTFVYKDGYVYKKINSFERVYVGNNNLTHEKRISDYFNFDIENNVISGQKLNYNHLYIDGACFEEMSELALTEALGTWPGQSVIKNYDDFDIKEVTSAILYAGYRFLNDKKHTRFDYDLEICKKKNFVSLKYIINDRNIYGSKTISLNNYVIPNLSEGNITMSEIDVIITDLQSRYENDVFIKFVVNELLRFKKKLQIKQNLDVLVLNRLSARNFSSKTFDDILLEVLSNYDDYFKDASLIFNDLTNDENLVCKEEIRIFKLKK